MGMVHVESMAHVPVMWDTVGWLAISPALVNVLTMVIALRVPAYALLASWAWTAQSVDAAAAMDLVMTQELVIATRAGVAMTVH